MTLRPFTFENPTTGTDDVDEDEADDDEAADKETGDEKTSRCCERTRDDHIDALAVTGIWSDEGHQNTFCVGGTRDDDERFFRDLRFDDFHRLPGGHRKVGRGNLTRREVPGQPGRG